MRALGGLKYFVELAQHKAGLVRVCVTSKDGHASAVLVLISPNILLLNTCPYRVHVSPRWAPSQCCNSRTHPTNSHTACSLRKTICRGGGKLMSNALSRTLGAKRRVMTPRNESYYTSDPECPGAVGGGPELKYYCSFILSFSGTYKWREVRPIPRELSAFTDRATHPLLAAVDRLLALGIFLRAVVENAGAGLRGAGRRRINQAAFFICFFGFCIHGRKQGNNNNTIMRKSPFLYSTIVRHSPGGHVSCVAGIKQDVAR